MTQYFSKLEINLCEVQLQKFKISFVNQTWNIVLFVLREVISED